MPGKNHSACGGLQNFSHDRVDLLAEIRTAVFDHDHCTIFHISYTLIDVFSFLKDISVSKAADGSAVVMYEGYVITLTSIEETAEPWPATFFIIDPESFGDDTIITDLR